MKKIPSLAVEADTWEEFKSRVAEHYNKHGFKVVFTKLKARVMPRGFGDRIIKLHWVLPIPQHASA